MAFLRRKDESYELLVEVVSALQNNRGNKTLEKLSFLRWGLAAHGATQAHMGLQYWVFSLFAGGRLSGSSGWVIVPAHLHLARSGPCSPEKVADCSKQYFGWQCSQHWL